MSGFMDDSISNHSHAQRASEFKKSGLSTTRFMAKKRSVQAAPIERSKLVLPEGACQSDTLENLLLEHSDMKAF